MINNTIERLRTMKMNSFASELERQMEDKASYSHLGFEERLALLVDSEWNRRQDNKLTKFIRNARFSAPSATIEGIEYIEDRLLAAITTETAISMFCSGAGAAITLLWHGTDHHKTRYYAPVIHCTLHLCNEY